MKSPHRGAFLSVRTLSGAHPVAHRGLRWADTGRGGFAWLSRRSIPPSTGRLRRRRPPPPRSWRTWSPSTGPGGTRRDDRHRRGSRPPRPTGGWWAGRTCRASATSCTTSAGTPAAARSSTRATTWTAWRAAICWCPACARRTSTCSTRHRNRGSRRSSRRSTAPRSPPRPATRGPTRCTAARTGSF